LVFKDFPGPGKLKKIFQGFSRTCSHPALHYKAIAKAAHFINDTKNIYIKARPFSISALKLDFFTLTTFEKLSNQHVLR